MEKDCTVKVERPVYEQQELQRTCGYTQPKTTLCDGVKRSCAAFKPGQFLLDRIPVLRWLPQYKWREDLVSDLISGATVAIMHIPQGMAYALLGNVPPIVGIYMAFFPVLVYFFLGTSRHVSMGTFAVICLMTGKTVVTYSSPDSVILKTVGNSTEHYSPVEVATAVAFMVGIFQLGMYIFQFGIVSMLLSDTLVNGFTTGAAIHVLTSQIKDLLGLEVTRFKGPFKIVYTYIDIFNKILEANTAAVVISAVSIIALVINNEALKPWVSKKSVLPVPIELILVITGTLVSQYMNLPEYYGVSTVGNIPLGLPNPTLPELSLLPYVALDSFTITMVAYTIAMSMALIFAQKKNYEVDSNQELLAQGAGNVVGSFFSCMPFTASLSRSLIQVTVGGKTQLASIVSCTLLLFVLLWIGPFFEPLPRSVLASIIIVALKGMLLQVTSLPKFWQLSTLDGIVWVATFLTVVFVDIDYGLLVGIILSLASIFIQGMKAYVCLLEPWPGTDLYLDTTRYKKTREVPGIKIFHYCGALNFASRNNFKMELYRLVGINAQQELLRRQKRKRQLENMKEESKEGFINISFDEQTDADSEVNCIPEGLKSQDATYGSITHQVRYIILDLSALSYVDPTGVATLRALAEQYSKIDIPLYIAGISGPAYEKLQKCGLFADEQTNIKSFPTVHDAVLFTQSLMNQYSGVHL